MIRITLRTSEMARTESDNFSHFMALDSVRTSQQMIVGYLPSDNMEIVKHFNAKSHIVGQQVRNFCGYSYWIAKHHAYMVRALPIVGTMASNVRPIDRKAVKTPRKGTLSPILKWANTIGNQWVNETVRSYRKTGK